MRIINRAAKVISNVYNRIRAPRRVPTSALVAGIASLAFVTASLVIEETDPFPTHTSPEEIARLEESCQNTIFRDARLRCQFVLAQSYAKSGETEKAKAAAERIINSNPGLNSGKPLFYDEAIILLANISQDHQ